MEDFIMEKLLNEPMKLDLQFFAEDAGGDNGTGDDSSSKSDKQDSNANPNQNQDDKNGDTGKNDQNGRTFTRDDVRKMLSAETNKAIEKFKTDSLPNLLEEAAKKGEERAKMSEAERRKADEEARVKELEAREQSLNQREALTATKDLLSNNELPLAFAEMLTDLDADKRTENVANFKKAFNAAVQNGVEQRLKGKKTPQVGSENDNSSIDLGTQFAQMANKQITKPTNDPWANVIK